MFLTKHIGDDSLFKSQLIPQEIRIEGISLITFSANPITTIPEADWLFFTSKNAVRFYFEKGRKAGNKKVGCVGKGTFKTLAKYIDHIDFVGDQIDIKAVASEFDKVLGKRKCVFPISNISKRTIQQHLTHQENAIDLVVYNTEERANFNCEKPDVVVFTSPSNVRAFTKKYGTELTAKIIAMGPSTAKELTDLGITNYSLPKSTGEIGLIDCILQ